MHYCCCSRRICNRLLFHLPVYSTSSGGWEIIMDLDYWKTILGVVLKLTLMMVSCKNDHVVKVSNINFVPIIYAVVTNNTVVVFHGCRSWCLCMQQYSSLIWRYCISYLLYCSRSIWFEIECCTFLTLWYGIHHIR